MWPVTWNEFDAPVVDETLSKLHGLQNKTKGSILYTPTQLKGIHFVLYSVPNNKQTRKKNKKQTIYKHTTFLFDLQTMVPQENGSFLHSLNEK